MDHHEYNERARDIWSEHASNHRGLPGMTLFPMQRPDFVENAQLAIVGMNPSFAREHRAAEHRRYAWRQGAGAHCIAAFVEEERVARSPDGYRPYYGRLREFASRVGATRVDHLDLLPVRHTSQAAVVAAYWDKLGAPNAVARACLQLFEDALDALAPDAVLVANAWASRRVRAALKLRSHDDGRTYTWPQLPRTTFFLSGMLTGQRALDEFSFDRLVADVRGRLLDAQGPTVQAGS